MQGSEPIQFGDSDDELHFGGEAAPASSVDGAESNRPAANANHAEGVDATTEEFEFQEDADDFLGLESEVEALTGSPAEGAAADESFSVGEEGALDVSDGWLLEVPTDENTAPVAEAAAAVTPAEADEVAEYVTDELASTELGEGDDEYGEWEDDDFAAEEGEFDEEFPEEHAAAGPSRIRTLALAGFLAGVLGTVGLLMLEGSGSEPDPMEGVATVTTPTRPAPTPNETTEATDTATETTGDESTADPVAEPTGDDAIESVLDGLLAEPGGDEPAVEVEPIAFEPLPTPTDQATITAPQLPGMPELAPVTNDVSAPDAPRSFLSQLESATERGEVREILHLETSQGTGFIWTGSDVPTASIAEEGRVLTPAVGLVRATMFSGELFEGRLYGVGDNRVWIEMGPGRVGLDGTKVERIERITEESDPERAAEPALGQRVRVRAAGGVLYGKVKSREGTRVTIVTDKGARITLEEPDIEPIGRVSGLVLN